jgi:hypothetical protein
MKYYRPRSESSQVLVYSSLKRVNPLTIWLCNSKQLDLLILACCSCLLTLLYQPIAHSISLSAVDATVMMTYPAQFTNLHSKVITKGLMK